jgi:hypothetical protein
MIVNKISNGSQISRRSLLDKGFTEEQDIKGFIQFPIVTREVAKIIYFTFHAQLTHHNGDGWVHHQIRQRGWTQ